MDLKGLKHIEYLSVSDGFIDSFTFQNLTQLRMLVLIECDFSSDRNLDFLIHLPFLEYLEIADDWDIRRDRLDIRRLEVNASVFQNLLNLRWFKVFYVDLVDSANPDNPVQLFKSVSNRLTLLEITTYSLDQKFFDNFFTDLNSSSLQKLAMSMLTDSGGEKMLELRGEWFTELKSLKSLSLSSNNIKRVESSQFVNLGGLEKLNLKWNNIEAIDRNTFCYLKNLRVLNLDNNPLIDIEPNTFQCLENLQELNLRATDVSYKIDRSWFEGLTNLTLLNLSDNYLENIEPKLFVHLINLKELNLSMNRINLNGRKFESLNKLVFLDLSFNQIERIDAEAFAELKSLECLKLNSNHLTELIPNWLEGLLLQELDLSFNHLLWRNFDPVLVDKLNCIKKVNLFGNFTDEQLTNLSLVKHFLDPQGLDVETYYKN